MNRLFLILFFLFPFAVAAEDMQDESVVLKLVSDRLTGSYGIGEWSLHSYKVENGVISFEYRNAENAPVVISLHPYDEKVEAYGRSRSFNIVYTTGKDREYRRESIIFLMENIVERISANDRGDIVVTRLKRIEHLNVEIALYNLLYWVTLYLLVISFGLFFLTIPSIIRMVRTLNIYFIHYGIMVLVFFLIGILLRFISYEFISDASDLYSLTSDAAGLEGLKQNSPVLIVLPSLLFMILPVDHRYIIAVNTLIGVVSIATVTAFFRRYGSSLQACLMLLTALSLSPVFIMEHRTASEMVFTLFFLFCGMILLIDSIEEKSDLYLIASIIFFSLTYLSKLVFVLITPLMIVVFMYFKEGYWRWLRTSTKKAVCSYLATLVLAMPGIYLRFVDLLDHSGQIDISENLMNGFLLLNPIVLVERFPVVITLAAIASISILYRNRQTDLLKPLSLAFIVSLGAGVFEKNPSSIMSCQTLSMIFFFMIAFEGFISFVRRRGGNLVSYLIVLALAFGTNSVFNYMASFSETPAVKEERFIREALGNLKEKKFVLVRQSVEEEAYSSGERMNFPDYLVKNRDGFIVGLKEAENLTKYEIPAFFYFCYSCYYETERGIFDMIPLCKSIADEYELSPVYERMLVAHSGKGEVKCGLHKIIQKKKI